MSQMTIKYFAEQCGGSIYHIDPELTFQGFSLDTRLLKPNELFIAVHGARVDGTVFAQEALNKGALAILTEKPIQGPHILVGNIFKPLLDLGMLNENSLMVQLLGLQEVSEKLLPKNLQQQLYLH